MTVFVPVAPAASSGLLYRRCAPIRCAAGQPVRTDDDIALVAANYGQDTDVDAQGRVTLPGDLRKILGLEGQEITLRCFQGRINALRSSEYERRLENAKAGLQEKLKAQQKKGL